MSSQLNAFEIKAEILNVISKLSGVKGANDFDSYEVHLRTLDAQTDRSIIVKLLFKEFGGVNNDGAPVIKYLLKRYGEKTELIEQLWTYVKSNIAPNEVKIAALDLLRELDTNWNYEDYEGYVEGLADEDTRRLLGSAIANPEVQIDFLDFISSLDKNDQMILLQSLKDDYTGDELANVLIPVFLSQPDSEAGRMALALLGESKSQLAFHALTTSLRGACDEAIRKNINKALATLKMSGVRQDNSPEFYKSLLADSKPYRFCVTYPDGHGNQAVIFSRLNPGAKVQFAAVVINDYCGIRDCFGFNEISQFEANAIIERFYRGVNVLEISPEALKSILSHAEQISPKSLPYEYVCWRNILNDVDAKTLRCEDAKGNHQLSTINHQLIFNSDFMQKWFLDANYSTQFGEFLAGLDADSDPDKIVDEKLDYVFCQEEKTLWFERILTAAHLKELEGETELAQSLRALYRDEKFKTEFLKHILKRSVYEYFVGQKNEAMIAKIEKAWVK